MPNNIPKSLNMMLKCIQLSDPSITFPIQIDRDIFEYD